MPDALPDTTLPIYPGLGQAQNMLACIHGGFYRTSTAKAIKNKSDKIKHDTEKQESHHTLYLLLLTP